MNKKSERSVNKNHKREKRLGSQEETRGRDPSEINDRVQRIRRTFHCSFTKPGGNKERWLIM